MDAWQVPLNHVRRTIDRSALYFCGFPTLQHIKHKVGVCDWVLPVRQVQGLLSHLNATI